MNMVLLHVSVGTASLLWSCCTLCPGIVYSGTRNLNCTLHGQVLQEAVSDLRQQGCDEGLLEALARGIAVHHGGLDTKYRQAVEMLFRSKHLQVRLSGH